MILPSAVQCAGRTTPTRSVSWNAPEPLVRAITTTESPMRTAKWPLSPVSRDRSSSIGRGEIDHLDFIERAGGERKQRPADAVTLGIALLPHVAQRDHRFGEMERGGIVQADELAEFGKPNALAVTRDFLEDRKRAPERLHAAALAVLGVVVDVGRARLHQPCDRRLAWRGGLVARLRLGSRFHGSGLHEDGPNSIRPSSAMNSMMLRSRAYASYTTIAIDVQYYEK